MIPVITRAPPSPSLSSDKIWHKVIARLPKRREKHGNGIKFQSNGVLTLGVEIELQLIDPITQNLASRAEELLKACSHIKKVKPEFYLSTIEINTGKCADVHEAEKDIKETLAVLHPIAEARGITFSATGSHPFAKYADCIISKTERYLELIDRNQWIIRRRTVYGLHVHIGMASGDDCIRFNNFFMHFLPHLLAISGSSPYWQGTDTGLSSCRPTTYESLPTAGQPYHVRNWRDFEHIYHTLKKCGSISSLKDLWWDLRPSPSYGTLEIRVCDGTATVAEAMAITAFIHTLAHWFNEHGKWLESVNHPPHWMSRENKWRAMRYGLDAELVMNVDGKTKPVKQDLKEWIEKLKYNAQQLGYLKYFEDLLEIIEKGNSSSRQRAIFQKNNSLEDVVKHNVAEFIDQYPRWEKAE